MSKDYLQFVAEETQKLQQCVKKCPQTIAN